MYEYIQFCYVEFLLNIELECETLYPMPSLNVVNIPFSIQRLWTPAKQEETHEDHNTLEGVVFIT